MSTSTRKSTLVLSQGDLITLIDRTAHALEQTARLERLLNKLSQRTAKTLSSAANRERSFVMARRAVGFTRAALEDIETVLPKDAIRQSKHANPGRRLAS